jgi:putative SOS response-associated peptidase YedK
MCNYTQQNASLEAVKDRFKAEIDNEASFLVSNFINGFAYPKIPIILDSSPNIITTDHTWGLLPIWSKDLTFRKKTLNARIETINTKPSYRNVTQNRCLIIATGYYEWHWNDKMGKSKDKYLLKSDNDEIFTLAGLYTTSKNPETGSVMNTFTMVTTEGNDLMKYIHNSKSIKTGNLHDARMPVLLQKKDEAVWLDKSVKYSEFALPYEANLTEFPKIPLTLNL